jgi:hypothetical protein
MGYIAIIFGILMVIVGIVLLFKCGSPGGSWIKQNGTIIEWDGQGNCNILKPDGTLHVLKDGKWTEHKE